MQKKLKVVFFFLCTNPIRKDTAKTNKFAQEFQRRMEIATSNASLKKYMNKSGSRRLNKSFEEIVDCIKKLQFLPMVVNGRIRRFTFFITGHLSIEECQVLFKR